MDRRRYLTVASALLAGSAAGCLSSGEPDVAMNASSPATPGVDPAVPDESLDALVAGTNRFAFDLLNRVASDDAGNAMVSPISATTALAMTYAGAADETRQQMRETLHYTLDDGRLHPAFNALQRRLDGRSGGDGAGTPAGDYAPGDDPVPFQLELVDAAWGQLDYPFRESYLSTLADHYAGGLNEVDFTADPASVRRAINAWVADQTEDRIEDLLPAGSLTEATRLVLTNAIYFMANWQDPFDEGSTAEATFTTIDGSTTEVQMMTQEQSALAASVDGVQAAELPYVGGDVGMLVVVPPEGTFESYEASFDAAELDRIVAALEETSGYVKLPRFEFEASFELEEALSALGMPDAFSRSAADFSRMYDPAEAGGNLFLDQVYHDTYIAVDEQGTEAAAATGSVLVTTSLPPTILEANRPFLFVIRDRPTGTALFAGRVVDAGAAQG